MNDDDSSSKRLLIAWEGPEATGKTSSVKRIEVVLDKALPKLSERVGIPIDYLHVHEPGGSKSADIMRTFIFEYLRLAEAAGRAPNPEPTSKFFTLARFFLYKEKIIPFFEEPGIHIVLSDRTQLYLLAIQGEFGDGKEGIPLDELDEQIKFATKGNTPDLIFLKQFAEETFAKDVAFRQLLILLADREVMPKDLDPVEEFRREQKRYSVIAEKYANQMRFEPTLATRNPFDSTVEDLDVIARLMAEKFPQKLKLNTLLDVFSTAFNEVSRTEGLFQETEEMVRSQQRLQAFLTDSHYSVERIVARYKETGNIEEIHMLKRELENWAGPEGTLPPQARR